jgi:hypothetical protein
LGFSSTRDWFVRIVRSEEEVVRACWGRSHLEGPSATVTTYGFYAHQAEGVFEETILVSN